MTAYYEHLLGLLPSFTKNLSNVLDESPASQFTEDTISHWIGLVASPILVTCGTIFNALSIIVLSQPGMRKMAASAFLIALAIVDVFVLYTSQLTVFVERLTGINPRHTSLFACKSIVYILVASRWCSAWIMVAMTSQRLIAVYKPLTARQFNTPRISLIVIISIVVICWSVASHFLGNYHVTIATRNNVTIVNHCAKRHDRFIYDIWPYIDMIAGTCVPFVLICICNSALVNWVLSTSRQRARSRIGGQFRTMANMTYMLLAVTFAFLTLTLPITTYFVGRPYWMRSRDPHDKAKMGLFYVVANMLQGVNHAINFVLYCVAGPAFRKQLSTLCCCGNKDRVPEEHSFGNSVFPVLAYANHKGVASAPNSPKNEKTLPCIEEHKECNLQLPGSIYM